MNIKYDIGPHTCGCL